MSDLTSIQACGFIVTADSNSNLVVHVAPTLTGNEKAFLQTHKAEILAELQAQSDANILPVNVF